MTHDRFIEPFQASNRTWLEELSEEERTVEPPGTDQDIIAAQAATIRRLRWVVVVLVLVAVLAWVQ